MDDYSVALALVGIVLANSPSPLQQSTLRPPEVHILLNYVHFNFKSAFALRIWELMTCVVCGRPRIFVRNTKKNKSNLLWKLGIALSTLLLYNSTIGT